MFYWLSNNNQTGQGDDEKDGFEGKGSKSEILEREGIILCCSITFRFTEPPAFALLRSCKNFADFSSYRDFSRIFTIRISLV